MKRNTLLLVLIVLAAGSQCFAGATEVVPAGSDMVSLLTSAGFHARKPETVQQRMLYGIAPSHRMLRAGTPFEPFYAYKDTGNSVAYVGDEIDYQRFRQIAAQAGYQHGAYKAMDMELDPAWRWSQSFR